MTITPIHTLSNDAIRLVARDQADADEPCFHGFEEGTSQAEIYEAAYAARLRELQREVS